MNDDLVNRLRDWETVYPEDEDKDDGCLYLEAADRIEELEAKLKKALGALGDIFDGEPEWPDDPAKELSWCRNRARTTFAELTGGNDE